MDEVIDTMIRRIARNYAARCWWAEVDELVQEGWVAALASKKTWNPDICELKYYAYRAMALHIRAFLWRMSAPVTGPMGHYEKLAGLQRAPVDDAVEHHTYDSTEAEKWWGALSECMESAVAEVDDSGAAARVLLLGEDDHMVAYDMRLPTREVRRRAAVARKRLKADTRLRELVVVGTFC